MIGGYGAIVAGATALLAAGLGLAGCTHTCNCHCHVPAHAPAPAASRPDPYKQGQIQLCTGDGRSCEDWSPGNPLWGHENNACSITRLDGSNACEPLPEVSP
jgi:hypothetical protein